MPYPSDHAFEAEAFFARIDRPGYTEPSTAYCLEAEVHAILATRAGTDEHYIEAEEALDSANGIYLRLHTAKMHALLAAPAAPTPSPDQA